MNPFDTENTALERHERYLREAEAWRQTRAPWQTRVAKVLRTLAEKLAPTLTPTPPKEGWQHAPHTSH